MKTIRYSRVKLVIMAIMSLLFVCGGIWAMTTGEGKVVLAGLIVAALGIYTVGFTLKYLADNTILTLGPTSLQYHGLLGNRSVRYDHVINVEIEKTTVNFVSQRHLSIKSADQTLGKTRVSEMLLERNIGKLDGVLDAISNAANEPEPKARQARRLENPSPAHAPNLAARQTQGFGRKVM